MEAISGLLLIFHLGLAHSLHDPISSDKGYVTSAFVEGDSTTTSTSQSTASSKYDAFASKLDSESKPVLAFLPRRPSPTPGASAPTNDSHTSTTGRPFDPMTGLSYRQLDIARQHLSRAFQLAAQGANVSIDEGPQVYAKTVNYIVSLWFPEDAKKLGLPVIEAPDPFANPFARRRYTIREVDKQPFWQSRNADQFSRDYGQDLYRLLYHLFNLDVVGYAKAEDDVAFNGYLRLLSNSEEYETYRMNFQPQPKIDSQVLPIYLHNTMAQNAAASYYLGRLDDEVVSTALNRVFRWVNARLAIQINLYSQGTFQRFRGPGLHRNVYRLEMKPIRRSLPLLSNSYQNLTDNDSRTFGPIKVATVYATSGGTSTTSTSNDILVQPEAAPGSYNLTSPPKHMNYGKDLDEFTGISRERHHLGLSAWSRVIGDAYLSILNPNATEADAFRLISKQAGYTFLLQHSEYAMGGINTYNSPEDVWTNASLDGHFASDGQEISDIIYALTGNENVEADRLMDNLAMKLADLARLRGESWFTLPYFLFTVDSFMEAAKFFAGERLSEEYFSALEDFFVFCNIRIYELYHQYNLGFRRRPRTDDFEMIGLQSNG